MRITSNEILHDPIEPILIRMMVPMVIGLFFSFLFTAVDMWFISKLGTTELAAFSFTAPVTFFVFSIVIGLSVALGIMVGKVIGKGDHDQAARITTDSLLFSFVLTSVVAVIGYYSIDWLFGALGATENTLPFIHDYMDVWFIFIAFLVIPMMANSALRATGDTKWASIIMVLGGLANVVLDPFLIFGWGPFPALGVKGAAYATVISWIVTFIIGMLLLGVREKLILFNLPPLHSLAENWLNIIRLGIPISVANVMLPITIAVLTAMLASHGEHAVAGFGAGGRVESFALLIAMAATAALSPYMAQNIGAGHDQRAHEACMITIKLLLKVMITAWIVLVIAARPLAHVFSSDSIVINVTTDYLRIMPAGAVFYALLIVFNTAFNAHHKSNLTLMSSIARLVVFIVPCAWLGDRLLGITGIYIGCVVGNVLSTGFAWTLYRQRIKA